MFYSSLYEALAPMAPSVVDEQELWQVASVLRFHRPPPEQVSVDVEPQGTLPPRLGSRRGTRKRRVSQGAQGLPTDTIRQRYLHDQDPDRYPAPTPKPASGAVFGLMAAAGQAGASVMVEGQVTPDAD